MNSILKKITIKELSEKDLEPIIQELTNLMIQNEVGVSAAEQIGKNLKMELTTLAHARFKDATPIVKKSNMKNLDNDIMTLEEVAAYLRLKPQTIYTWAQEKKIPAAKLGKEWRFKKSIIDDWFIRHIDDKFHDVIQAWKAKQKK